jgi:hypothetical protein
MMQFSGARARSVGAWMLAGLAFLTSARAARVDDVYAQIQTRLTDLRAFADQVERSLGAGEDA